MRLIYRFGLWVLVITGGATLILGSISALLLYWYFSKGLPSLFSLKDYKPNIITEIYADDGTLIGEFAEEYRKVVPYNEIPPYLVKAFVSAEDARFFKHKGIDFYRLLGALWYNIRKGNLKGQGGSTLTMQVARSFYLSQKKLFSRKIRELILAVRIERYLTKEEILYLYLNQIYFGRGAYGVGAAAIRYFGKNVSELTLAESALLAGLPRGPNLYSPVRHFEEARARQHYVLNRMVEDKIITQEEAEKAKKEPITIVPLKDSEYSDLYYFTEQVRRYLVEKYGVDTVMRGGLKVFTTLNVSLQKAAQRAVQEGLAGPNGLDKRQGYRGPIKKLKDKKEQEKFLEEEENWLARQRAYSKGVTYLKGDDSGAPSVVSLEQGVKYQAVILGINEDYSLKVGVGKSRGIISADGYSWACPKEKANKIFEPGDVVLVELKEPKNSAQNNYNFILTQEPQVQAGLIAFSVHTGEVKALVGGYDFRKSQLIRPLQSKRQPGSAFKPIIYCAALAHPLKGYTPASIVIDSPIVFEYRIWDDEDRSEVVGWRPQNYGGGFVGPVTLREALAKSINTISIKLLSDIGVSYFIQFAKQLGITSPLDANLSVALGSSPVSLFELTRAYNVFASGGFLVEPHFVRRVYDRDGNLLEYNAIRLANQEATVSEIKEQDLQEDIKEDKNLKEAVDKPLSSHSYPVDPKKIGEPSFEEYLKLVRQNKNPIDTSSQTPVGKRVITPQLAYIMTSLLKGVVEHGTGYKASQELQRPLAGKTGTTNDFRDAWFIGYSPEIICGVWVGFDDFRQSIGKGETGSRAALPIWISFMKEAVSGIPVADFSVPDGIEFAKIDQETGLLAGPCSERVRVDAFYSGTAPVEISSCGSQPKEEDLLRALDH